MPGDPPGTIRSLYASFNETAAGGDIASFVAAYFDPECEYRPVEEIAPIRGHDALVQYFHRWFEPWQEMRIVVDELLEAGDVIFAAFTVHGRGGGSDSEITQKFFHVFRLRGDRVLRTLEYLDRAPALEAAGLEEASGA